MSKLLKALAQADARPMTPAPTPANGNSPKGENPVGNETKPKAKAKPRRMAFTPKKVERRETYNGKPYIWARGDVVYRRRQFTYTVMVPFWRYSQFDQAFGSGCPIELEGTRVQVRTDKSGKPINGGHYIQADRLLGVLDHSHDERSARGNGSAEPSRHLKGHERRGYYRRQRYGAGNALTKVIWVDSVKVNGGRAPLPEIDNNNEVAQPAAA